MMDRTEMPPMDLGPDGPQAPPPAQDKEAGLWEAFLAWLAAKGGEQNQAAGQNVAEEANKALPESLSARPGIEEDRRRKAMIDSFLREQ